jgi:hypothetical protein
VTVSKTVGGREAPRGFESHPLRYDEFAEAGHYRPTLQWAIIDLQRDCRGGPRPTRDPRPAQLYAS